MSERTLFSSTPRSVAVALISKLGGTTVYASCVSSRAMTKLLHHYTWVLNRLVTLRVALRIACCCLLEYNVLSTKSHLKGFEILSILY